MLDRLKILGLVGAFGLGLMTVAPASAQYMEQTEGSYSGRYSQDYDYNTGRSEQYEGETYNEMYGDGDADDDRYVARSPDWQSPECMSNEGRYTCSR